MRPASRQSGCQPRSNPAEQTLVLGLYRRARLSVISLTNALPQQTVSGQAGRVLEQVSLDVRCVPRMAPGGLEKGETAKRKMRTLPLRPRHRAFITHACFAHSIHVAGEIRRNSR